MEAFWQSIERNIHFLAQGGIMIVPIVVCSLIAVAFILERLWYYHQAQCNLDNLTSRLVPLVKQGQTHEAVSLCEQTRGVLPGILKIVVTHHHLPSEEIEKLVSIAGTREIQRLSHHVRGLGIIGHVTPLMGLLGTVLGMVRTFIQIAELQGHVNPSVLAGGIWEALLTTAAGLTVAIPVVILHHYCEGTVERFAFQMKNESLQFIHAVKYD
jgi:biopolymer transport protein ExbB